MRTIHTQEIIRHLRNNHPDLDQSDVTETLNIYMKKLQNSGHDAKYRKEILISGLNGYRKQLEASEKGIPPLYRPRAFQRKER